ncbi:hypothetical protein CBM2633_U10091 [Cupriavidus taiwanensis]|nr:hypothetical protein CBM2633_U10091 [Cupriavidus taiwanensis]
MLASELTAITTDWMPCGEPWLPSTNDCWLRAPRRDSLARRTAAPLLMGYINPLLRLPAARKLLALPEDQRRAVAEVFRELRDQSNAEAELAWKRRKGPMAAYWRAVSTYARHVAHALKVNRSQLRLMYSGNLELQICHAVHDQMHKAPPLPMGRRVGVGERPAGEAGNRDPRPAEAPSSARAATVRL